jgi:hypothetical protein
MIISGVCFVNRQLIKQKRLLKVAAFSVWQIMEGLIVYSRPN